MNEWSNGTRAQEAEHEVEQLCILCWRKEKFPLIEFSIICLWHASTSCLMILVDFLCHFLIINMSVGFPVGSLEVFD